MRGQMVLSCLAVTDLVFKDTIDDGEVNVLTSILNESSMLDKFTDATSPGLVNDPFVVLIVMDALWVTTLCFILDINSSDIITLSAAGSRRATQFCSSTLISIMGKEVSIASTV